MAKTKLDWEFEFDQFHLKAKPAGVSRREFALSKGVDYTYLSKRFTEIEREKIKLRFPQIMKTALDNVEQSLNDDELDKHFRAKLNLDTVKTMGAFEGYAQPQTQVNTTVNLGVALFSQEDLSKAKEMAEGGIIDDVSESDH